VESLAGGGSFFWTVVFGHPSNYFPDTSDMISSEFQISKVGHRNQFSAPSNKQCGKLNIFLFSI
jgi:hypothetical protein